MSNNTTEQESSAYISQLLVEYYAADEEGGGVNNFDALTFLLADILHHCDHRELNYEAVMKAARWHHNLNNSLDKQITVTTAAPYANPKYKNR